MRALCCLAPSINTEQLRSQLDQLHTEADRTRSRANNARSRLLRLSEAAEKLHRQAALSVKLGKEDYARDLLFQKKKIMLALQKSKDRIELLENLAAKLTEAVSIKETQLVRNVASDLEFEEDDASTTVRIVSPSQDMMVGEDDNCNVTENDNYVGEAEEFHADNDRTSKMIADNGHEDHSVFSSVNEKKLDFLSSLRGVSSYSDLLQHVDYQLSDIEEELATILRLLSLVIGDDQKLNTFGVQQTKEILEDIRSARARIQSFMQKNGD